MQGHTTYKESKTREGDRAELSRTHNITTAGADNLERAQPARESSQTRPTLTLSAGTRRAGTLWRQYGVWPLMQIHAAGPLGLRAQSSFLCVCGLVFQLHAHEHTPGSHSHKRRKRSEGRPRPLKPLDAVLQPHLHHLQPYICCLCRQASRPDLERDSKRWQRVDEPRNPERPGCRAVGFGDRA